VSALLPDGVANLADCPHTLYEAIITGLRILGYEEFPLDERPPKEIWVDGEKLVQWWEQTNRKRREKYGLPETDEDGEQDGGYEENALVKELIKRG
jgi:hypothetical protein